MKVPKQALSILTIAVALAWAAPASAHCDTLDGPVVAAARQALDAGDPRLVLGWVSKQDEAEIRRAFERTVAVRAKGAEAKALADTYFFETVVRVHRAGEGAGFTGLKPAGQVEVPVAAADKALATGDTAALTKLLAQRVDTGVRERFQAAAAHSKRAPQDVEAGRAFVGAYVDYVHYVERLYDAAGTPAPHHAAPATPIHEADAAHGRGPARPAAHDPAHGAAHGAASTSHQH